MNARTILAGHVHPRIFRQQGQIFASAGIIIAQYLHFFSSVIKYSPFFILGFQIRSGMTVLKDLPRMIDGTRADPLTPWPG
jgi:hypothetical protein